MTTAGIELYAAVRMQFPEIDVRVYCEELPNRPAFRVTAVADSGRYVQAEVDEFSMWRDLGTHVVDGVAWEMRERFAPGGRA